MKKTFLIILITLTSFNFVFAPPKAAGVAEISCLEAENRGVALLRLIRTQQDVDLPIAKIAEWATNLNGFLLRAEFSHKLSGFFLQVLSQIGNEDLKEILKKIYTTAIINYFSNRSCIQGDLINILLCFCDLLFDKTQSLLVLFAKQNLLINSLIQKRLIKNSSKKGLLNLMLLRLNVELSKLDCPADCLQLISRLVDCLKLPDRTDLCMDFSISERLDFISYFNDLANLFLSKIHYYADKQNFFKAQQIDQKNDYAESAIQADERKLRIFIEPLRSLRSGVSDFDTLSISSISTSADSIGHFVDSLGATVVESFHHLPPPGVLSVIPVSSIDSRPSGESAGSGRRLFSRLAARPRTSAAAAGGASAFTSVVYPRAAAERPLSHQDDRRLHLLFGSTEQNLSTQSLPAGNISAITISPPSAVSSAVVLPSPKEDD